MSNAGSKGRMPIVDDPESRGSRLRDHRPTIAALDVAENILLMDALGDLIAEPPMRLTRDDLNYPHDSIGDPGVRSCVAALLSDTWALGGDYALCADHVLCTPGASAALHLHAKARLKEGDTVLVPAPYWQMFDRIYRDAGVKLVPLPIPIGARSAVDLPVLQSVYANVLASGERPCMLLLTNPHNPLGLVASREDLEEVVGWVLANTDMEVVSDEIYAHSVFDSSTPFVSALGIPAALRYPERVHVIWGFAKDFGLSGWMVGVLLTRCGDLHEQITRSFARFSPFDGLKNRVLRRLLAERPSAPPKQLLQLFSKRLRGAQRKVAKSLDDQNISYATEATGAPFFWIDLRAYLDADLVHAPHPADCILDGSETAGFDAREGRLQKYLACAADVVLLRGQTMHSPTPGFFRLCFSALPAQEIVEAVERMGAALRATSP